MPKKITRPLKGILMAMLFGLLCSNANAQKTVTGKVTGPDSKPVFGATILVKGTNVATSSNQEGAFSLTVPPNQNTLVISFVGNETMEVDISGRSNVDIAMKAQTTNLNEIVVTGYTAQRKKDIIGSVAIVGAKELQQTPASSLAVQLQGRAPGVTVTSSGEPGAGAVVRIRGLASAGNNNPLYIIDGVPTTDPNKFNPNDVESIQVLKDAASASQYGARASNGVVIVTTKQGKTGRMTVSYDGYAAVQVVSDKMMPDMLNTAEYVQYLQKTQDPAGSHPVFGKVGSLTIPAYYITSSGFKGGVAANDPRANPDLYSIGSNFYQISPVSAGTDWFGELTRPALMTNHQLTASGGTDKSTYSMGLNYFDQQGTFVYTNFKRYSARINTSFKPTNWLRLGENIQVSYEDRLGGANRGEGDAWASAYRMVPYVPVYDIKGGFGGNGVGESGNGSNPIANLKRQSNNKNSYQRLFGNAFAEIPFTSWLTARTSFGIDLGNQMVRNISVKTYERSENQGTTQLTEEAFYYLNWTWTNTLVFQKTFAKTHDVKLLVGSEAIKETSRGMRAFGQNFDTDNPDFITLTTANAGSLGDRTIGSYSLDPSSLYSLFSRLDYAYKNKYLLNATFRRDASSRFGPNSRYANFPSAAIGWRISEEKFMQGVSWIRDLKLRAGWGTLGSQSNVAQINQYFTYISAPNRTNYDIGGGNTSAAQGYRADRIGNLDTKWETLESKNIGLDATFLNGSLEFVLDVYQKDTRDLLVDQLRNGLAPLATLPRINVGTMRNTGFEFGLNYSGKQGRDFDYRVGLNFSRYKNEMTKFNNENSNRTIGLERLSNAIRTEKGRPISYFYGFIIDGFYNTPAEVAAALTPGATLGSWRYRDVNDDKKIDDNDRTYLGDPHPDFQMGFNLEANWKNFSFNAFLFWNQGNEVFNYTKYYTDMRVFVGGVSKRVLYDTWTETNMNAKLPRLGPSSTPANNGYTSFTTGSPNSYYVEDGSFFRAKTVQLGYTFPKSLLGKVKLQGVRIYVQAQNLFTITKYQGSDPDIQLISRDPNDRGDYYLGVDLGGFPTPKQYLAGLSVTF